MSILSQFSGGTGGAGMALGLLIMPMSIAALLLRRPSGPIRKLVAAGATSEALGGSRGRGQSADPRQAFPGKSRCQRQSDDPIEPDKLQIWNGANYVPAH